jgi:integrase
MVWMNVKHVHRVRSKGRLYHYHRVTSERLPVNLEEAARRAEEINRSLDVPSLERGGTGSIDQVISEYRGSPEFLSLSAGSKDLYQRHLDTIGELWGRLPISRIERHHVKRLRNSHADRHSVANQLVAVLRVLLGFAVEMDYRPDNPALKVKPIQGGENYRPWPDWAIERFRVQATPEMVLAMELGVYTGQRKSDVVHMSWRDYDGRVIYVVQQKTGAKLEIPVHRDLKTILDGLERTSTRILTTARGRPLRMKNFDYHFRRACDACGLQGYVFHGLRYSATGRLFEAGCTPQEVQAITGHKTLAMVQQYGQGANQKRMATAAIEKLERNRK